MGLSSTTIRFPRGFPSFAEIKRQYKTQTGLDICLTAKAHIIDGELVELATTPSQILSLLNAEAAAVQQLEATYALEKESYVLAQQYENAAAVRDRINHDKQSYNHIQQVALTISYSAAAPSHGLYEPFYSVEFEANSDTITIYQHSDQVYAVESLIKVLVDLGGEYLGFASGTPQLLPQRWSKLKQWKDYRWYNRPKK